MQKEALEKKKEELRSELITLRKEKKKVKEEVKSGTGQEQNPQELFTLQLCISTDCECVQITVWSRG